MELDWTSTESAISSITSQHGSKSQLKCCHMLSLHQLKITLLCCCFFLKEKPNLLAFNGSLLPYLYHLMNSGYELCIIHPIFLAT